MSHLRYSTGFTSVTEDPQSPRTITKQLYKSLFNTPPATDKLLVFHMWK